MQDSEFWAAVAELTISNTFAIGTALVALAIGWFLSRFVSRQIRKVMAASERVDATMGPILAQIARYAILIVTAVIVLSQLGVATTSILAVLGAAGLAIALALQGTLSNIAAGVMLVWLRPFSSGEYIEGNGAGGTVTEIGLFATRLRTPTGQYLFVPNSQLWDTSITNYSRLPVRRLDIRVGIGYSDDIKQARTVMMACATSDKRVHLSPEPVVHVDELGDSAVIMLLRGWTATSDYWAVKFAMTEAVKLAFDEANIEIAYNTLDVNITSDNTEIAQ